jgi:hypothetical protein
MDKLELVNKLRTNAFLVNVTLRAPGRNDEDIAEDIRLKLAAAQRDVKDAIYDRTMMFGDKRLAFNDDFMAIVQASGPSMLQFQEYMKSLREDKQNSFAIERGYEPVPAPDGFGMLSEAVTASLSKHVEDRVCKQFYAGLEDTVDRLKKAAGFYLDRLTAYHATQATGTRAVLRDVVVSDLRQMHALVGRVNIIGSDALDEVDTTLAAVVKFTTDELRKSAEKRVLAIDAAKVAVERIASYVGA